MTMPRPMAEEGIAGGLAPGYPDRAVEAGRGPVVLSRVAPIEPPTRNTAEALHIRKGRDFLD
ncbi:hypothetical protein JL100_033405 (plasmid) [Skermanella mucosa]|uniref:hypothetical protein n=1 Tax=Skermanella mucosa TaxID=1789672 RepID=UPI00192AE0F9|nr:hypothetical protein [Skermanella mucosa]UEM24989.1 hypothetical protein JL100_033405 [Skermanella mucosa]